MNYQQRWLLAVAMKQPYPRPEAGAVSDETKATQASIMKIAGAVAAVGVVGYLLMR
jgi:hypothetical protein